MPVDKDELALLDDRYVRICDCSDQRREILRREADLDKAIARLDTKMTWLVAILSAVGAAVLTIAVKLLFAA